VLRQGLASLDFPEPPRLLLILSPVSTSQRAASLYGCKHVHDTFIIYAYPGSDCRLGALNFPALPAFSYL